MYEPITQDLRDQLWDQRDRLPEPYGYTIKANKDGSTSLTLGGKKGHTKGRPTMRTRGPFRQIIADASDYIRLLEVRGDIVTESEGK